MWLWPSTRIEGHPRGRHYPNATCTVDSASLVLQVEKVKDTHVLGRRPHRVTNSWTEGTLCDKDGVANWTTRVTGTNWGSAGGDYAATVIGSTSVSTVGVYTWTVTSLVQQWVNGYHRNNLGCQTSEVFEKVRY